MIQSYLTVRVFRPASRCHVSWSNGCSDSRQTADSQLITAQPVVVTNELIQKRIEMHMQIEGKKRIDQEWVQKMEPKIIKRVVNKGSIRDFFNLLESILKKYMKSKI